MYGQAVTRSKVERVDVDKMERDQILFASLRS